MVGTLYILIYIINMEILGECMTLWGERERESCWMRDYEANLRLLQFFVAHAHQKHVGAK